MAYSKGYHQKAEMVELNAKGLREALRRGDIHRDILIQINRIEADLDTIKRWVCQSMGASE